MSKTSFVLTLLFFVFSAQADTYNCDYQEQFILGNQNLFVKEFKISNVIRQKYQTEDQACDCANKNKPIIGPNRSDSEKDKKRISSKNQEQIGRAIKHMLTIIDDFTMIEKVSLWLKKLQKLVV